ATGIDHPDSSKHQKTLEWPCVQCSYINSTDYKLCIMCGIGKQSQSLQAEYNKNNDLIDKDSIKQQDIYNSNTNSNNSDDKKQYENTTIITSEVNWTCGKCTLENAPSINICEVCGASRAFSGIDAPVKVSASDITEEINVQPSINNTAISTDNACSIECYVPEKTRIHEKYESKHQQLIEWGCSECTYINSINDRICVMCNDGKQPEALQSANNIYIDNKSPDSRNKQMSVEQHDRKVNSQTKEKSVSDKQNEYTNNITTDSNYISQQSSYEQCNIIPTNEQVSPYPENKPISGASHICSIPQTIRDDDKDEKVYIIDLPHNTPDEILEEAIRSRLDKCYNIKVKQVKCYSVIGMGIIILKNNEKINLLTKIQSILLPLS
ncbi:unnamed protein product, partial [Didymodactylos carnosus]